MSTVFNENVVDKESGGKVQPINSTSQPTFELTVGCGETDKKKDSDEEPETPFELVEKDLGDKQVTDEEENGEF